MRDLKGANGRPNGCSIRTQPTERGIAYGGRPLWQRSRRSSQRMGISNHVQGEGRQVVRIG